ncbi:MAG: rhamnulokinase, partial [Bullifex sp.]
MKTAYAVDLGASSGRVMKVILSDDDIRVECIHRFPGSMREECGSLLWDPEYLVSEIKYGLEKASPQPDDSIGIDTWGVDYVLTGGNGRDKAYCYRDA